MLKRDININYSRIFHWNIYCPFNRPFFGADIYDIRQSPILTVITLNYSNHFLENTLAFQLFTVDIYDIWQNQIQIAIIKYIIYDNLLTRT